MRGYWEDAMTSRNARASASPKLGWLIRIRRTLTAGLRRPGKTAWLVIVPSVAVFCGLAGVLVYVLTGGGSAPTARARPVAYASPNPDTTEPVPQFHVPAPVVPVALPSTGAIPLLADDEPQVKAWKSGSGGTALSAVTSHAGAVAQARGLKEYVEMKQECSELASSVSEAQAGTPIPDAAMQAEYQKALSELGKAAAGCQAAISEQPDGEEYVATTENSADLSAVASELAAGSQDLYVATGQISDLGLGS
jgi:hypothetical protein